MTDIDRRTLLRYSATAATFVALTRPGFAQQPNRSIIDDALRAAVERGDIPGVSAAVTDATGTVYENAFGKRRLGGTQAMTVDTVCYLASMTKPITATCAMQLVEQGKLDLDSPISRWIPSAAKLQVLDGFDADGKPQLRAPTREVTLRDLMTHSSGFAYTLWDADLVKYANAVAGGDSLPALDYDDDASWLQPLMFDPGSRWEYGISIDWIGRLVQTVSGESLGGYMKQHIFDPLGMTSTGFKLSPDMEERRASSHQRDENGELAATDWVSDQNPPREYGGGGLYGDVGDYQRFMRMILNKGTGNGNRILKAETVAEMTRNNMGTVRVDMLHTTNPARSLDAEFFPGLEKSWGLSFMINEEAAPTGRPAGSLAWAGIQNTFFWIDLRNEIGGVFMSQVLPFVDTKTLDAFYEFETAYYKAAAD